MAPPVSAVSLTFTGLSKSDVDKAMSRLDEVLDELLVTDSWTNSPHKAAICKLSKQQVLQGCHYTLALALICVTYESSNACLFYLQKSQKVIFFCQKTTFLSER